MKKILILSTTVLLLFSCNPTKKAPRISLPTPPQKHTVYKADKFSIKPDRFGEYVGTCVVHRDQTMSEQKVLIEGVYDTDFEKMGFSVSTTFAAGQKSDTITFHLKKMPRDSQVSLVYYEPETPHVLGTRGYQLLAVGF